MELSETLIKRISLLCSILGIAGVMAVSPLAGFQETKLSEISLDSLEKKVEVAGFPENGFVKKGTLFFDLVQGKDSIKVVVFRPKKGQIDLALGKGLLKVKGEVQLYEKELEIIGEEVLKADE